MGPVEEYGYGLKTQHLLAKLETAITARYRPFEDEGTMHLLTADDMADLAALWEAGIVRELHEPAQVT